MRIEWDEAKNLTNQRKHGGIDFETAARIFDDPYFILVVDRVDEQTGEQRWHAIGAAEQSALLLVVHVYRSDLNDEEIIRIISARAAGKHDIRRYRQQAAH